MNSHRPILLVEDNALDVDLTQRVFARLKLPNPLEVARDGAEALEHIERWEKGGQEPAFILLDIKLPKFSGLEVLHQLKTHARFRRIPVIMLTASDQELDIQTAYHLGANSYIIKPMQFEVFLALINHLETYWLRVNTAPA